MAVDGAAGVELLWQTGRPLGRFAEVINSCREIVVSMSQSVCEDQFRDKQETETAGKISHIIPLHNEIDDTARGKKYSLGRAATN